MTVCAHRPEDPGFFTSCNPCICGREVVADIAAQTLTAEAKTDPEDQT